MTANAAGWLTKRIARDVGFWHKCDLVGELAAVR